MPAHEILPVRCQVCSQRYCRTCSAACPACQADHPEIKIAVKEKDAAGNEQRVYVPYEPDAKDES